MDVDFIWHWYQMYRIDDLALKSGFGSPKQIEWLAPHAPRVRPC